ncbi:MAG: S8 family serine peptidase, partial [archaeon]
MQRFFFSFVLACLVLSVIVWADDGGAADVYLKNDDTKILSPGDEKVKVLISMKDEKVERRRYGIFREQIDSRRDIADKIKMRGGEVDHKYNNFNLVTARLSASDIEELKKDPNVVAIEEVMKLKIFLSDSVPLVNADDAWLERIYDSNITGAGVSICVLDTGINDSHPALNLSGKIIGQYCYCNTSDYGDGGCCPNNASEDSDAADDNGHGTHVAGIVAASGGIDGVAKGANIIAIKVANITGWADDSDIIWAIDWCIDNSSKYNISVISLSMGGGSYDDYCDSDSGLTGLKRAIDKAVANNICFVAATGNAGSTTGVAAPACLFNATRVGATTNADVIWDDVLSGTNRGVNFSDILLAPGVSITSTLNGGGYGAMTGTSMATPHVSGAIALLSQAY